MTSEETQKKIDELVALRAQTQKWRWGASAIVALTVISCVTYLGSSVRNLFVPGHVQDQYVTRLTAGLKTEVVPYMQSIATEAFTESKPVIDVSFAKLNDRVPELTKSTMEQFDLLKKDIPASGDKVLTATYGAMLKRQEAKIHTMVPEATDANVAALVDNMTKEGSTQLAATNNVLFSKHMAAISDIEADLTKIQNTETISPDQDKVNWEMALMVVDGFHQSLTDLKAGDSESASKSGIGVKK